MKNPLNITSVIVVICVLLLNACGGGSGSTPSVLSPPSNFLPIAVSDKYSVNEDESIEFDLVGTDSDGSVASYSISAQPSNGAITATQASVTYTPNSNFNGDDSFRFTVTDNEGAVSAAATIEITVKSVNDAPSATSQTHIIDEDINLALNLSGVDIDGAIVDYAISLQPENGTISGEGTGAIYTPDLNFHGNDRIEFSVTDNEGATSNIASIEITINPVNDAPIIALNSEFTLAENVLATGIVLNSSATDPEQDDFTFALGQQLDSARFSIDEDSSEIHFVAAADYEKPVDGDSDNIYQLEIIYTDVYDASASKVVELEITDVSNLDISMIYPTPNANLGGGVTETTVRGTLVDLEDNQVLDSDLDGIKVNGVETTLSEFNSKWSLTLPISEVSTVINLSALKGAEVIASEMQSIENVALPFQLETPRTGALDKSNNRLIIADLSYAAILGLDLTTGATNVISDRDHGQGIHFESISGLALDTANNLAYVTDTTLDAVIAVDLTTGSRTIISDSDTDIQLEYLAGIALDVINNRLFVVERINDAVIQIDISTGEKTIIASNEVGTGAFVNNPDAVAHDRLRNKIYIASRFEDTIVGVDLTTGDRAPIASDIAGTGIDFSYLRAMAVSDNSNDLFFIATVNDLPALLSLELATLNRSIVASQSVGNGVDYDQPRGVILDSDANQAWILDYGLESIVQTDLSSGARAKVGQAKNVTIVDPFNSEFDADNNQLLVVDSGNFYTVKLDGKEAGEVALITSINSTDAALDYYTYGMALDELNNQMFIVAIEKTASGGISSRDDKYLLAVDLATGLQTTIANLLTPFGSSFALGDIIFDRHNNRTIYIESDHQALMAVDITTGVFTVLAENIPHNLSTLSHISLDLHNNQVLVLNHEEKKLLAIDLATGDSAVLSADQIGTGPVFSVPRGLVVDSANNRALVIDAGLNQLLAVDLSTGNRSIISEASDAVKFGYGTNPVLDSDNNRLFWSDSREESVYVIDLTPGERAIIAL